MAQRPETRLPYDEAVEEAGKIKETIKKKREAKGQKLEAEAFGAQEYVEAEKEIQGERVDLTEEQEKGRQQMIEKLARGYFDDALEIKEEFNLPVEVFNFPEIRRIAMDKLLKNLKGSSFSTPILSNDSDKTALFRLFPEFMDSQELRDAVKSRIFDYFADGRGVGDFKTIRKMKEAINISDDDFLQAAKDGIMAYMQRHEFDIYEYVQETKKLLNFSSETANQFLQKNLATVLAGGNFDIFLEFKTEFNLPEDIDRQVYTEAIVMLLNSNDLSRVLKIEYMTNKLDLKYDEFNELPEIRQAAVSCLTRCLSASPMESQTAEWIISNFKVPENIDGYVSHLKPYLVSLVTKLEINKVSDLIDYIYNQESFIDFLSQSPEQPVTLEKADLPFIEKFHLTLVEAEEIKRSDILSEIDHGEEDHVSWSDAGESFSNICAKNDFNLLFYRLKNSCKDWRDPQNIGYPFEDGAGIFGAEKMLAYLDRPGLSRHDGLHAFRDIVTLCQASGFSPEQFYTNILAQVQKDDSRYESGTAHHELNSIAQSLNLNIKDTWAKAGQYQEVEMLQALAASLDSPQAVFASWNNLKRYVKLAELLERSEILDQLKDLKKLGKPKLYHYIEILAFHPSSKVDMKAVLNFWRDPETFLAEGDGHTPAEVHDRKKPSNYVEIPNLDLTAEELRDALVEGKMDDLQAFTPMEITYQVPLEGRAEEFSMRQRVIKALGSRSEGVKGQAKDAKKLFSEINKVLKPTGITVKDYLAGREIGSEVESQIAGLLLDETIGLPDESQLTFVAKISKKSDPEAVLAGNDTSCCMPFGAGKNTVYTFNPVTSLFTLQIVRPDGNRRTIAQSVLAKDKDVRQLLPEIIKKMQNVGEKISDIVSEEILIESQSYLGADNVQVAPNFTDGQYPGLIEKMYRDFFQEYMKRFAKEQELNPDFMPVGKGYSVTMMHLPEKANTFVPLAPVGYTDTVNASDLNDERFHTVYSLDLTKPEEKLKRKVSLEEAPKLTQAPLPKIKGLSYLTFQDSLAVAYLEGKAYSDNESLMTYLHNMENGLIAKDINNAAKGRENMSLKYVDAKGKMRGYMFAYEGRRGAGERGEEDYEEDYGGNPASASGEPVIYISDFASDKESPVAAGAILKGFTDLYRRNYLEKGNLTPIYAEAREQTSYRIIQKNIEDIGRDLGIEVEVEELPTYQSGEDMMHPVMIRAKKAA